MSVERTAGYELYNPKEVPIGGCGPQSGTLTYLPLRKAKDHKIRIVDLSVGDLPQCSINTNHYWTMFSNFLKEATANHVKLIMI
jgi:hypothetical protein